MTVIKILKEVMPSKKRKSKRKNQVPLQAAMHNVDVPNIATNEVLNIAAEEGQLSVWITPRDRLGSFSFVKNFSTGQNHFNTERKQKLCHLNIYRLD